MCMKWNKPTPPSRFPRSLACWTYNNNDLGYPLGGVSSFHMIHIEPDDTGRKPSPKLPQFLFTCKNTLEASYYIFLSLAPKICKTEAPVKDEIVALTPTNACTCLLER